MVVFFPPVETSPCKSVRPIENSVTQPRFVKSTQVSYSGSVSAKGIFTDSVDDFPTKSRPCEKNWPKSVNIPLYGAATPLGAWLRIRSDALSVGDGVQGFGKLSDLSVQLAAARVAGFASD